MERRSRQPSLRLDVESLRAFLEVVDRGGFTAASRTLGITQPAVSLRIRRLEDRIGARLIRREGLSLAVTAQGRDLMVHAAKIVESHDMAVDHMRRSQLDGRIRLGLPAAVAPDSLLRVARRFKRTHPSVQLTIRAAGPRLLAQLIDAGELDVALMPVVEAEGAVRSADQVWRHTEVAVVQGLKADLDDEDPVPLVSFGSDGLSEPHLIDALQASGRGHWVAAEWASLSGALNAIEAGLGVCAVSAHLVSDRMRPFSGVSPLDIPPSALVVRSRHGAHDNELVAALRNHLTQTLGRSLASR